MSIEKDDLLKIICEDLGNLIFPLIFGISFNTLAAIGEAFCESDPNVYGEAGGAIYLVMIYEKYDILKN